MPTRPTSSKSSLINRIATEQSEAQQIHQKVESAGHEISDPASIETTLRQHPAIQDAAVIPQRAEAPPTETRLAVYVVANPRQSPRLGARWRYSLPNGLAIVHHNKFETDYLYQEIFEQQVYLRHGISLEAGACVVDVGANIGLFTLYVQSRSPHARIYAFEPAPPLFELLRWNTRLYAPEATVFNYGLADTEKSANLTFYPAASLESSYHPESQAAQPFAWELASPQLLSQLPPGIAEAILEERHRSETFTTSLRPLSAFLNEQAMTQIDLLKIDAEGSEVEILNGIHHSHWAAIRQIVIEVHGEHRLNDSLRQLEQQGYSPKVEKAEGPGVYRVYGRRPSLSPAIGNIPLTPASRDDDVPLLSADELRRFVRQALTTRLPPLDILFLDTLPRNAVGRLEPGQLPPFDQLESEAVDGYLAPRTPIEQTVAEVWAAVLGVEQVGLQENFYTRGGDSLMATQVLLRLHTLFEVELPLQLLYTDHFNVAELARAIEAQRLEQADPHELAALLQELDQLTDEQVKKLLEVQQRSQPNP